MFRPVSILWIVSIVLVITIANAIAEARHLFFFYWWLDMPLHLLGGLASALFTLWVIAHLSDPGEMRYTRRQFFVSAVMVALGVGVTWELSEFLFNRIVAHAPLPLFLFDTAKDLSMDLLGAMAGSLYVLITRYNDAHV
jgi:hypothetical protein